MNRRRVLHVIGGLQVGGAETLLYRLVTLRDPAWAHEVVCLGERDWYSALIEERGVMVHHLGIRSLASLAKGMSRLRGILRRAPPDVIQSWMYLSNFLSGMAGRTAGVPVVWSIHASSIGKMGLASRLSAYAGGAAAKWLPAFVINCSARAAEVHARLGYGSCPGAVIPNGYDPQTFFPDGAASAALRQSLGIDPATFLVGTISRWHDEKDIPNLIEALRKVRREGVPLVCLLVGGGLDASNAELSKALRTAGLLNVVRPLGTRSDLPDLARAIDLHVLASRGEAFPNVVAETMLSGTPNVATDVGDTALIVGETGWLVPPRAPDRLAEAISGAYREWRDEEARWEERRAAARQRIMDRFTIDRMVDAYHRIWAEVSQTNRR